MGIIDKSGFFGAGEHPKSDTGVPTPDRSSWDDVISPEGRQVPRLPVVVAIGELASAAVKEARYVATGLCILGKSALLRMRPRD